jgi:hypothetical protein
MIKINQRNSSVLKKIKLFNVNFFSNTLLILARIVKILNTNISELVK